MQYGRPRRVTAGRGDCASGGRLQEVTRAAVSLNDGKAASDSGHLPASYSGHG